MKSVSLISKIYDGSHFDYAETTRRKAKKVWMASEGNEPVLIDLDGEQPGRLPALYTVHPAAVKLKV